MAEKIIELLIYGTLAVAVFFSILVLIGSIDKGENYVVGGGGSNQYALHFVTYVALSFSWYVHLLFGRIKKPVISAIKISIVLGIVFESIQYLLPFRFFDPVDMGMNILGSLVIIGILPFSKGIDYVVLKVYRMMGYDGD